jgi:hypothetical protein
MTNGFVRAAMLGALAILATTSLAEASQTDGRNRHIQVYNESDTTIMYIYATPTDVSGWADDLLGQYVLESNYNIRLRVRDAWDPCHYDIRAVFSDNTEAYFWDTDVCRVTSYTFTN